MTTQTVAEILGPILWQKCGTCGQGLSYTKPKECPDCNATGYHLGRLLRACIYDHVGGDCLGPILVEPLNCQGRSHILRPEAELAGPMTVELQRGWGKLEMACNPNIGWIIRPPNFYDDLKLCAMRQGIGATLELALADALVKMEATNGS